MIKRIFYKLITPLALSVYMLRYRTIWRMFFAMQQRGQQRGLLFEACMLYFDKRGSYVGPSAKFDGVPCFPHGVVGVFISSDAVIGRDCVIFQQVTVGSNNLEGSNTGAPTLGDNVYIGAGAKIIGRVFVGDGCRVGANAVVYTDMPPNSVAVCAQTRIIERGEAMNNRHYRKLCDETWEYFSDGRYHKVGRDAHFAQQKDTHIASKN